VGGCCQDADPHLSTLMFHPKRDNSMRFSVAQRHLPGITDSWVDVFSSPVAEHQRAASQMTTVSGTRFVVLCLRVYAAMLAGIISESTSNSPRSNLTALMRRRTGTEI